MKKLFCLLVLAFCLLPAMAQKASDDISRAISYQRQSITNAQSAHSYYRQAEQARRQADSYDREAERYAKRKHYKEAENYRRRARNYYDRAADYERRARYSCILYAGGIQDNSSIAAAA